ncbi:MAG: histidine kinase [Methylophilaceae bacterium]
MLIIQAGSLFLLDYIPGVNGMLQNVNEEKIFWQLQREMVSSNSLGKDKDSNFKFVKPDFKTKLSQPKWLKVESDSALSLALKKVDEAQAAFDQSQLKLNEADFQLKAVDGLIDAYQQLAKALERDVEMKQSVISLLQLVALFLIVSCLGSIALGAKRLLFGRIDTLISLVSKDAINGIGWDDVDEFAKLERLVYETSARLEGFKSESQWFSQVSGERLRRMIRSQDFLHKFIESVNADVMLNETSLRNGLFLLEKALNINNVALIFTEENTADSSERVLFSHHSPANIKEKLLEELTSANFIRFVSTGEDNPDSQCIAAGFMCPSGALGILKVEADVGHVFDDSEIQLIEVTAKLLSMVMGFKGREQESRRVALLEERSAIARELHDSLAQSLSFMKIQIARLQTSEIGKLTPIAQSDIVNELRDGLDIAYRELRELLSTFRVHMDVRGLSFAILSAIDEYEQRSNLTIMLDNRLQNNRLTVNEEFHILHVIREALANIIKHSGATTVNIALTFQAIGTILVTIDDDGIGYNVKSEKLGHYGQKIMKERASSLGGEVTILRRRGGGTRVRLVFIPKQMQ